MLATFEFLTMDFDYNTLLCCFSLARESYAKDKAKQRQNPEKKVYFNIDYLLSFVENAKSLQKNGFWSNKQLEEYVFDKLDEIEI